MKKLIWAVTALLVMICAVPSAVHADTATEEQLSKTIDYTVNTLFADNSEQFGDEWYIIALARSGDSSVSGILDTYYLSAQDDFKSKNGEYTDAKGSQSLNDYVRVMMALTAMGKDVTDFGGYDLCQKIGSLDFSYYSNSSTSTLSYALNMIDFYSDKISDSGELKKRVTEEIMTRYIDNTGFTYMLGDYAAVDPDTTAQVIQTLCRHTDSEELNDAVNNSYAYLISQQGSDNGAILSWGAANPSSTAQCIISAASSKDRYSEFTTDSGKTLLDGLMDFSLGSGGFYEPYYGEDAGADYYTTSQALLALTAYSRMTKGQTALFDFSDITFGPDAAVTETTAAEPEKTQASSQTTSATAKSTSVAESPKTSDSSDYTAAAAAGISIVCILFTRKKKSVN